MAPSLKYWLYEPATGHAHKQDAAHVTNGAYGKRCLLCGTGEMHGKALRHLASRKHAANFSTLKTLQQEKWLADAFSERSTFVNELEQRVASLGLPRWRWELQARLFKYIRTGSDQTKAWIHETLEKYEKMERLSLLELAVWKASLVNDPFFETLDDLDAYWTLDRNFDPVAYKNNRRVTSGITAIIQGVLSFLD